jgi:hypothetical protein
MKLPLIEHKNHDLKIKGIEGNIMLGISDSIISVT